MKTRPERKARPLGRPSRCLMKPLVRLLVKNLMKPLVKNLSDQLGALRLPVVCL